jgi:ribonuclease-3
LAPTWFSRLLSKLGGKQADPDANSLREAFGRKYAIWFNDPVLLKTALTHRSCIEPESDTVSNERLEFLGDSVLGVIASDYLFRSMPGADEGEMTKARSRIVNKNALGRIGINLGILDLLIFARDELREDERALITLSADALEAIIGAIYLDGGMGAASDFVITRIVDPVGDSSPAGHTADNKSELQEVCQANFKIQPEYRIVKRVGPEHRKIFHVVVRIRGETYGFGSGRSRKEAEQVAAGQALLNLSSEAS